MPASPSQRRTRLMQCWPCVCLTRELRGTSAGLCVSRALELRAWVVRPSSCIMLPPMEESRCLRGEPERWVSRADELDKTGCEVYMTPDLDWVKRTNGWNPYQQIDHWLEPFIKHSSHINKPISHMAHILPHTKTARAPPCRIKMPFQNLVSDRIPMESQKSKRVLFFCPCSNM